MNSINSINSINNSSIAHHNNANTNSIANARISSLARRAVTLLALLSLVAVSHTAAKADVVLERYVGTEQALGVPGGATAMQFKVRNTDNAYATNLKINTFMSNPTFSTWINPSSSPFTLAPYETKWINVPISYAPFYGQVVQGLASMTGSPWPLQKNLGHVEFLYVAPPTKVQASNVTSTGQSNGIYTFTVTFINYGDFISPAQTAKVATWKYADGQVGPTYTQTCSVPALQVGQSYTQTFATQQSNGYQIKGTVQVNTGATINFAF